MALDRAQSGLGSRAKPGASIYTTHVRTALLRECPWKCKSRRAVSATTACCWPSNFEATRHYQSAESIATKKLWLLSFYQAYCKSNSGFGPATLKEIGIAKSVAQTVQLKFLHKLCSPKSHRLPPAGFRKARTCVETVAVQFAHVH